MAVTWRCHICNRERPFYAISIRKTDVSEENGRAPGSMVQKVRYCNDRAECRKAVETYRFLHRSK